LQHILDSSPSSETSTSAATKNASTSTLKTALHRRHPQVSGCSLHWTAQSISTTDIHGPPKHSIRRNGRCSARTLLVYYYTTSPANHNYLVYRLHHCIWYHFLSKFGFWKIK
jgi:hypothetical protein